jgi:hypothetical protein
VPDPSRRATGTDKGRIPFSTRKPATTATGTSQARPWCVTWHGQAVAAAHRINALLTIIILFPLTNLPPRFRIGP